MRKYIPDVDLKSLDNKSLLKYKRTFKSKMVAAGLIFKAEVQEEKNKLENELNRRLNYMKDEIKRVEEERKWDVLNDNELSIQ